MSYRLIIGVVLFIFSNLISFEFVSKLKEKREFFFDFYNFNLTIINEINFTKKTIPKIIEEKFNEKSCFYRCIKNFFENKKLIKTPLNSKNEEEFLINYFNCLGKSDSITQQAFFDKKNVELKNFYDESINKEKINKPLYLKMGVMIGLILLVAIL